MNGSSERRSHWRRNLAICGIVISLPVLAYLYAAREWEESEFASVRWKASGRVGMFECTVTDEQGRPIPGANVEVDGNSGMKGERTDGDGRAEIIPGEPDISGIAVNGKWVVRRAMAYELGAPSVRRGLNVRIRLKDLAAFGITSVHPSSSSAAASDRDRTNVTSMMAE